MPDRRAVDLRALALFRVVDARDVVARRVPDVLRPPRLLVDDFPLPDPLRPLLARPALVPLRFPVARRRLPELPSLPEAIFRHLVLRFA